MCEHPWRYLRTRSIKAVSEVWVVKMLAQEQRRLPPRKAPMRNIISMSRGRPEWPTIEIAIENNMREALQCTECFAVNISVFALNCTYSETGYNAKLRNRNVWKYKIVYLMKNECIAVENQLALKSYTAHFEYTLRFFINRLSKP